MDELKTSAQWQEQYSLPIVHDPDGWDRRNFQFSWHEELITFEEYQNRVSGSTVGPIHRLDEWYK